MKADRFTGIVGVCSIGLLILFFATSPTQVPALLLVVPFVLLFVILFTCCWALLSYKKVRGRKKVLRIAVLCAGLPVSLLVLQSIGQLTLRDVLTIIAVFLLSYFYLSRTAPAS